jgi:transcriptional regulator with XRE-family HTH domain
MTHPPNMPPEARSAALKRLRVHHALSQAELADVLCIAAGSEQAKRNRVSRWERGEDGGCPAWALQLARLALT